MIHLTQHDARELFRDLHPVGLAQCRGWTCKVCNITDLCDALSNASKHRPPTTVETALHDACTHFREYTDKVCDTYTCPSCPDYSWCTTLRGIAIEGVKLDTD